DLILEVKKETAPKSEFFVEEKKNITVAGNIKEYVSDYSLPKMTSEIKVKITGMAKRRKMLPERISARPMDFLPRRSASPVSRLGVSNRRDRLGVFAEKDFSREVYLKSRIRIISPANLSGKPAHRFSDMRISSEKKLKGYWEANINERLAPEKFLEIRRSEDVFSPSFAEKKSLSSLLFPKLAFGLAAVLLFFLLFQAAVFFKGDLARLAGFNQTQGTVAGASDEKGNGITNVKSEADYYLSSSADAMKESVSFSRLMVRTALERNNGQ
ncbi:MAG: hypothetical protein NT170_05010, partial [Candidatus Moranbacteria bacterium]|nr:hypothetical protein [Candidatus Moranbacteria bacterium]